MKSITILSKLNKRYQSAFTIIEVVLVLAIAGLIFLMVFIALPALQRNQRDTQRKNDVSRLKTAIDNYKANNKGNFPAISWVANTATHPFSMNYLKSDQGEFQDPDGGNYSLWTPVAGADPMTFRKNSDGRTVIYVVRGAKCGSGDGSTIPTGGSSNYLVAIQLESGGLYCVES